MRGGQIEIIEFAYPFQKQRQNPPPNFYLKLYPIFSNGSLSLYLSKIQKIYYFHYFLYAFIYVPNLINYFRIYSQVLRKILGLRLYFRYSL